MSSSKYDFGVCSNPGITYDSSQRSFTPNNAAQFPFSTASDIAALQADICRQLRTSDCAASSDAIKACRRTRRRLSGHAGQEAADAWNKALGVDGLSSTTVSLSESVSTESSPADETSTSTPTVTVELQPPTDTAQATPTTTTSVALPQEQGNMGGSPFQSNESTPTKPAKKTLLLRTMPALLLLLSASLL